MVFDIILKSVSSSFYWAKFKCKSLHWKRFGVSININHIFQQDNARPHTISCFLNVSKPITYTTCIGYHRCYDTKLITPA
ncbi:hypothetical protein BDFB_014297 [Asbolus verrucosus]|uniref:Uncharacterized protein n=1 Tax=Asbolus verrucosus TaxID=1661398 RepID=A0A482VN68_ASBVE|nr:hypothetical protein BDFB_014297 [Asbolus verrucosus]